MRSSVRRSRGLDEHGRLALDRARAVRARHADAQARDGPVLAHREDLDLAGDGLAGTDGREVAEGLLDEHAPRELVRGEGVEDPGHDPALRDPPAEARPPRVLLVVMDGVAVAGEPREELDVLVGDPHRPRGRLSDPETHRGSVRAGVPSWS